MMTFLEKRFITLALFAFLAFAISGCLGAQKPPPDYYMLDPGPPGKFTGLEHGIAIGIGPFSVAPHLNRLQIVTRESDTRLKMSEAHQWAAPLKDTIWNILAINLAKELNTNRIYEVPSRQKRTLAFRVGIDILRLEGQLGGDVELLSRWIISSGDGKKELISKISHFLESTRIDDYEAYAEAKSRALTALSKEIAAAMKTKMK
jgi:uncharacterized lipoprotein YmbA